MSEVCFYAGTANRESRLSISSDEGYISGILNISVEPQTVQLSGVDYGDATGGKRHSYKVLRTGKVRMPISVAINLCQKGLSDSSYEISKEEVSQLLEALSKALKRGDKIP